MTYMHEDVSESLWENVLAFYTPFSAKTLKPPCTHWYIIAVYLFLSYNGDCKD